MGKWKHIINNNKKSFIFTSCYAFKDFVLIHVE